jgi:hypothetical protein
MDYDLFISHASEDKEFVRPLAAELQGAGLRVWLDELELRLGDSLRRTIDGGLARSKYGVVVLSPAFLQKEWPNKELDGLFARESGGEKVVLPIWHNVSASDIAKLSPLLADRLAVSTSTGLKHVADQVIRAVRASAGAEPRYLASCESEEQTLRRIREKMLVARSSRDLRGALYELDTHTLLTRVCSETNSATRPNPRLVCIDWTWTRPRVHDQVPRLRSTGSWRSLSCSFL